MIREELKGFNINIDDIEPNEITHGAMQELIKKIIMEENKVVLKLKEYIDLIETIKVFKQKLEYKDKNYVGMLNYVKDTVRNDEVYHIRNFDGKIEDTMVNKIKDYNYKNIADSFMSKGITFDLAIELTDELINERNINNE